MSIRRVVAITGCDSGLGWALAARSARENYITVAGMLQGTESEAAAALRKLTVHPYKLDVTDSESVTGFRDYVNKLISQDTNCKLHAVVNNAGVMTIGNYEWQTPAMIQNMINVNLLGAMRIASAFLPHLRKTAMENTSLTKPRLINIASHCGLQPLPGFGAYSASKAGVIAWTRALRMEHYHQGLAVVAFVPGGFVGSSNILAKQVPHETEMISHLSDEQKNVYAKQINTLSNYLGSAGSHEARFDALKDEYIIETFMKALNHDEPKILYKVESLRYMFYYNLLRLPLPEVAERVIIERFLSFPKPA